MKIMFLGDTHADIQFTLAAIDFAVVQQIDAIVQVGDFGVWDHIPAGVDFLDGVNAKLEQKDLWMLFVDGNHENFDRLLSEEVYPLDPESGFRPIRPRLLHAPRGHVWNMGGLNFLAFGGGSSIDGPDGPRWWGGASRSLGNGWWPQERITQADVYTALANLDQKASHIDVMVTHDVPTGVKIPGITRGYPAGDACREAVSAVASFAQPQLMVCGHYHRRHTATFEQTHVEILAHNEADSGQVIMLETDPFTLITEANA